MSLSPKTDKVAINDEGVVIYMGAFFIVISSTGYWVCDYSGITHYTPSNMMQASDDLLPESHLLVSREELDAMLDEVLFAQEVYDEDRIS